MHPDEVELHHQLPAADDAQRRPLCDLLASMPLHVGFYTHIIDDNGNERVYRWGYNVCNVHGEVIAHFTDVRFANAFVESINSMAEHAG